MDYSIVAMHAVDLFHAMLLHLHLEIQSNQASP